MIVMLLAVATMLYTDNQQGVMPWPDKQMKIYDRSGREASMRKAARIWNSTGLGIKIRLVKDPKQADVIAEAKQQFGGFCKGPTTIGCAPLGNLSIPPWKKPRLQLKKADPLEGDQTGKYTAVAAHEIGHLLGMEHDNAKCSLMNSKAKCRDMSRNYQVDQECPILNDTLALDPISLCPGSYTEILKCGPSYHEVDRLTLRYGGKRNPNYRSFCQEEKTVTWQAWCLYPNWKPAGQKTPDFIEKTARGKRCSEQTPARHLAVISLAVEEIDRQIEQLKEASSKAPTQAFIKTDLYQKMKAERIRRLEEQRVRYRQMMPPRLRSVIN